MQTEERRTLSSSCRRYIPVEKHGSVGQQVCERFVWFIDLMQLRRGISCQIPGSLVCIQYNTITAVGRGQDIGMGVTKGRTPCIVMAVGMDGRLLVLLHVVHTRAHGGL